VRVVWSPSALRQVLRILDYLAEFNPQAAVAVAEGLIAAGDSLALFPHRGRPVPGTDRRDLVAAYPYVIRYRIARGEEVRILRVRHAARRPTTP
jgi:toxin ParE1/3/4